ncbi:MAG TPA: hypothetical protein VEB65_05065 [Solirubrobacterales bacterium]|nr:hypothetical protein [Solirubrobacterales bacterium]
MIGGVGPLAADPFLTAALVGGGDRGVELGDAVQRVGQAWIVAGVPSRLLPPWLETEIASQPMSTARRASSGRVTPLSMNGPPHAARSQARSSKRLTLITTAPSLQANSMLRYAAWRRAVAEWTAARLELEPDDLVPETVSQAALGASMAAFTRWVGHPREDLETLLDEAYAVLDEGPPEPRGRAPL